MEEGPQPGPPPESPAGPGRSIPMAAVAGAIVLVGLVAFALYRRHVTMPEASTGETAVPVADAAAPGAEPAGPSPGVPIKATLPIRLTPEASILAERYRCVCGCNDTLSVCTCRNPSGSEEMKTYLQGLAGKKLSPEQADEAMAARFGAPALLSNPAPPQTLPSHAAGGSPRAARPPTGKSPASPQRSPQRSLRRSSSK